MRMPEHTACLFGAGLLLLPCAPSIASAAIYTETEDNTEQHERNAQERSRQREQESMKEESLHLVGLGAFIVAGCVFVIVVIPKIEDRRERELEQMMLLIERSKARENEYYAAWLELQEIKRVERERKATERFAALAYRPHPGKASYKLMKRKHSRRSEGRKGENAAETQVPNAGHRKKKAMLKTMRKNRSTRCRSLAKQKGR